MKRTSIFVLIYLITIIGLGACDSKEAEKTPDMKPLQSDFDSLKALIDYTIPRFLTEDKEGLRKAVVSKQEYIESIHGHTPEGSTPPSKGGLTGEKKWRIFTGPKRNDAIGKVFRAYANKGYQYVGFGEARTVIDNGLLKLHRRIPVKLKEPGTGKIITDSRIMAVVAEKNGKFKLLNVFKD